jgi:hypothetical protein
MLNPWHLAFPKEIIYSVHQVSKSECWPENCRPRVRGNFGNVCVSFKIILKWILEKRECVYCVHLAKDRVRGRAVFNVAVDVRVP